MYQHFLVSYGVSYVSGTLTSKLKLIHNFTSTELFTVYVIRTPPLYQPLDTDTDTYTHRKIMDLLLPQMFLSNLSNLETTRFDWRCYHSLGIAFLICLLAHRIPSDDF